MPKLTTRAIAPAAAPTTTATGTGVDVSDFTGNGRFVLDAAAAPSGQTLTVTLEHSDTLGSGYTSTGVAFTAVTSAGRAYETISMSLDGFKKFVRPVSTIAGGSTAHPHQVTLVGNLAL